MAAPNIITSSHPQQVSSNQAIRLLASATGVSLSATGDAAVMPIINSTTYSVSNVVMTNASASLSSAAAGVFTAPAAGGTALVANAALSGLTGSTVVSQRTVASTAAQTGQNVYLNVGTAQAGTTVDIYVYGYDFS